MKYNKVERLIIALTDSFKYDFYRCEEHLIYANLKESDDKCPYCKKSFANINDEVLPLQAEFQKLLM